MDGGIVIAVIPIPVTRSQYGRSKSEITGSARPRSPRTTGASATCAYTAAPSHDRTSAAEPAWSSCPWVITTRRTADLGNPSDPTAAAIAAPLPGTPESTNVTSSPSRHRYT